MPLPLTNQTTLKLKPLVKAVRWVLARWSGAQLTVYHRK
jgi:hypothetical protein